MTRIRSLATLVCLAALAACGDKGPQDITSTASGARVKFFNFGLNAPAVNFYANDAKMTGTLSTSGQELNTGTTYGGVGSGGFYDEIAPGDYTLSGRITAATDNGLPIATIPATIVDGKSYSAYLSGVYDAATKKVDGFIVEDAYPVDPDFNVAYVRFVNAIYNSSPMTLYLKNVDTTVTGEIAVGGPVTYKSGGAFTSVPAGTYNLSTRVAGSSTNAIARTSVTFAAGRVYTIGARGDITITSTTATNRPFLDNTTNR
jgi:hypothetical protein